MIPHSVRSICTTSSLGYLPSLVGPVPKQNNVPITSGTQFGTPFGTRHISVSPPRFEGLHQISTPPKRLKFGIDSRPLKRVKNLRKSAVLPAIPFEPTCRGDDDLSALNALQQRRRSQGTMVLYYKVPLMLVEGRGQYLFDEKGFRYLDMFGGDGSVHVGHNHPLVSEAITNQSTKLTHLSHHFLSEESSNFTEVCLLPTCDEYILTCAILLKTIANEV